MSGPNTAAACRGRGRLQRLVTMAADGLVLRTEGITKRFPGTLALDDVDFSLRQAEIHGLVGENGAGKSTFVKILSGVYSRDAGGIWLDGSPFNPGSILHCSQSGISIIFQETAIVPDLTVAENIFLNELPEYGRLFLNWGRLNARASKWMDQLGIRLDPRTRAGTLPIGQQKMVELVKSVSTNPKILILDEITANLDAEEEELLFRTVHQMVENNGVSVIYISHRMREIFNQCHQVTIFKDGRLAGCKPVRETSVDEVSSLMVGRELKEKSYYREHTSAVASKAGKDTPALEVENLSSADSFQGVSFAVYPGEILGIGGLSDAGQQSIAATLYGDQRPDSGRILVGGKEVQIGSPATALELGIGFLPRSRDQEGLILVHSISDNICLPILRKISRWHGTVSARLKTSIAAGFFQRLNIRAPSCDVACVGLSGGNRQKVVFAKLMASEVRVLILNHPTWGVDVGARQEFYILMHEFTKRGLSIILISDELPELIGMSDRIIIMRSGQIAYVAKQAEAITEDQLVRYMLK